MSYGCFHGQTYEKCMVIILWAPHQVWTKRNDNAPKCGCGGFLLYAQKESFFFWGGEFMFYLLPNFFHYFLKLSFGKIKNKIKTTFLYHGPHDFCSKRASFASLNAKPIKSWQRIMSAWKWTFWGPRAPWSLLHCFLDVNWSWPGTQQPITYFRGARKKFHDPTNVFA